MWLQVQAGKKGKGACIRVKSRSTVRKPTAKNPAQDIREGRCSFRAYRVQRGQSTADVSDYQEEGSCLSRSLWLCSGFTRGPESIKIQVHMEMEDGEKRTKEREEKDRGERETGEVCIWGLELPWVDRVPR